MAHSARALTLGVLATLLSGCYLAHRIDDPVDGAVDAGVDARLPPLVERSCCLALECGGVDEACAVDDECRPRGCGPACEGPRCAGVCCGAEQLCVDEACVDPGPPCSSDAVCGEGSHCDPVGRVCVRAPRTGCFESRRFQPEVQWEDVETPAITVPVVTQLNDDDGDGRIGASDIPDIVTIGLSPLGSPGIPAVNGRVVARSGDDGHILWAFGDGLLGFCSHSTAAAGDLDGDGTVEIIVLGRQVPWHRHLTPEPPPGEDPPPFPCVEPPLEEGTCPVFPPDRGYYHDHGRGIDARLDHRHAESACSSFGTAPGSVFILSHEGEIERRFQLPFVATERRTNTVMVADLDADGGVEVIVGGVVIGAEGVRWSDPRLASVGLAVGDIDLDGMLEIVTPQLAFEHDGTLKWEDEAIGIDGHPVIARVLPEATGPQVIALDGERLVVREGATGRPLLGPVRFAAGISSGPPTVADFDGDGFAEIGVAADHAYVVFDLELPPPHVRWEVLSLDRTPGTVGSAAFDFDADGADDVLYSDECHVNILSGRDGNPLFTQPSPSLTVWEYPVVADVDGDGHAELVLVSNENPACVDRFSSYRNPRAGLQILRDRLGNWGATRPTWNQHGYTRAIDDDGRVPVAPPRSWQTHNSVRANPHLSERGPALPNLGITAHRLGESSCDGGAVTLEARVENRGNVGVPAGVEVAFGSLTVARTTRVLLPGGAEWVRSPPMPRAALLGPSPFTIRADPREEFEECDEGDFRMQVQLRCAPR